jgi:hypothetical protein
MRVYVNLDSREFVVSPVLLQRVSTLFFTRARFLSKCSLCALARWLN